VLEWHRLGYLRTLRRFALAWSIDGEQLACVKIETQRHIVTLEYQSGSHDEDQSEVGQRVAIAWTQCRFGGERPWFVCSVAAKGVYCGRRVTKLYGAERLFACRHCYRLGYASQQEPVRRRGLGKLQKIRMRLGGSPNMLDKFPVKPKGLHWRTYERWRRLHDVAAKRSTLAMIGFVERERRRSARGARRRHRRPRPTA
jgi:hypothetical protein